MSNPLLEPVHGVTLQDYAAITAKIAAGFDVKELCAKLGLEPVIYADAAAVWASRMQEDHTYEVAVKFGDFFAQADNHPKLTDVVVESSEVGKANLEKLKTDRYFYAELTAASTAADDYGLDSPKWILDTYEINFSDYQVALAGWAETIRNENETEFVIYSDYYDEKYEFFKKQFAEEQGGNLADDIEF